MPPRQTSARRQLKHISGSSRNEFEIPACEPSSIESLEGIGPIPSDSSRAGSRGQHRTNKAMCRHYENFHFSTKAWFKGIIQCAEFQYNPSGAVVSLTSYDAPIRLSGLAYIKIVKKCADILRIMRAEPSTRIKNRGRNFSDAALKLAARASLHPIGWRRVPGQQSIAAYIRTIKECTVRMRFSSTVNSGLGDNYSACRKQ